MRGSVLERFFHYTPNRPLAGCWVWEGGKSDKGYAHIDIEGETKSAFRFAYEQYKGNIPTKAYIDHLCRNPSCVNPFHGEAVSHKENVLRGIGPTAVNARKTQCKRGHLLEPSNLVPSMLKKGRRSCLICSRMTSTEYRRKQKALNQANAPEL